MLLQYTPWHVTDNRISYFLLIIFWKIIFLIFAIFAVLSTEIFCS